MNRKFTDSNRSTWSVLWLQEWSVGRISKRVGASKRTIREHLIGEGFDLSIARRRPNGNYATKANGRHRCAIQSSSDPCALRAFGRTVRS